MGRSDRASSRPPVRRTRSSAVRADTPVLPGRGRRIGVGHGASVAQPTVTGRRSSPTASAGGQQVGRRDRVGRDPSEQLERHHRHLDVADLDDRRAGLLDLDGDDQVRGACLAADESDERVVEEVVLPGAPAVVGLRVPDLGGARLAADVVARDERPVAVEGTSVMTWCIISRASPTARVDDPAAARGPIGPDRRPP